MSTWDPRVQRLILAFRIEKFTDTRRCHLYDRRGQLNISSPGHRGKQSQTFPLHSRTIPRCNWAYSSSTMNLLNVNKLMNIF